jgi:hypothetical protein
MAVELRNSSWLDIKNRNESLDFFNRLGIGLVIVDDPGFATVVEVTNKSFVYIRIHRREGEDRLLSQEELQRWKDNLNVIRKQVTEPNAVYLLWNTNHLDQSIVNARNLMKLEDAEDDMFVSCLAPEKPIANFFKKAAEKQSSGNIDSTITPAPKRACVQAAPVQAVTIALPVHGTCPAENQTTHVEDNEKKHILKRKLEGNTKQGSTKSKKTKVASKPSSKSSGESSSQAKISSFLAKK